MFVYLFVRNATRFVCVGISWRITPVRVTQEDLQRQRSSTASCRATVPQPGSNPPSRGVAQPLVHVQGGPRARTKPGFGRTTRSWSAAGTATGFKWANQVLNRPQPRIKFRAGSAQAVRFSRLPADNPCRIPTWTAGPCLGNIQPSSVSEKHVC